MLNLVNIAFNIPPRPAPAPMHGMEISDDLWYIPVVWLLFPNAPPIEIQSGRFAN